MDRWQARANGRPTTIFVLPAGPPAVVAPAVDYRRCTKEEREWLGADGLQDDAIDILVAQGYQGKSDCHAWNASTTTGLTDANKDKLAQIVEAYIAWHKGWGPWLIWDASSAQMLKSLRADNERNVISKVDERFRQQANLNNELVAKAAGVASEKLLKQGRESKTSADTAAAKAASTQLDLQSTLDNERIRAAAAAAAAASEHRGLQSALDEERVRTAAAQSTLNLERSQATAAAAAAQTQRNELRSQLAIERSHTSATTTAAQAAQLALQSQLVVERSQAATAAATSQSLQLSLRSQLQSAQSEPEGESWRHEDAPRSLQLLVDRMNNCREPTRFKLPRDGVVGSLCNQEFRVNCRHTIELYDGQIWLGTCGLYFASMVLMDDVCIIGGNHDQQMAHNRLM